MARSHLPPAPEVCPVCGADVPPRALACRECGADHETGWNEDAAYLDGVDLPDDRDDDTSQAYGPAGKPVGASWWVWVTAVLLILGFVTMLTVGGVVREPESARAGGR